MAGISPATLERIRAASDIVDVIGAHLPLKKAGANFTALCPFHKEKTPSFNVNPHKQIFHCFGCHKGGDVFTFVKEYENIGFVDAVRRLAERAKIPLEFDNNPAEQQSRHLKDQLAGNSRKNHATLAKLSAQRSRRTTCARLSGQARRFRRRDKIIPSRCRAGILGRHGELGEKQKLRFAARRKSRADHSQGRDGKLLRPISRAADVSDLRRAGQGDWFQRTHFVRRRKDGEVCQLAGDADFHQEQSFLRPRQIQTRAARRAIAPSSAKASWI